MSRIFFLDVTVFKIHITDTIISDAQGDTIFHVKIDLIDIPSLIISRNECLEDTESCDDNCQKILNYYAGRACHFVSNWQRISHLLKTKPLKIGIYRSNETFPVCHGILPFSGCVCDLVTKAMHESGPLELRGIFNLIDPGGNPAGIIDLAIILSDLGEHVIALFALDHDSFVVRNELEGVEYVAGKLENYPHPNDTMNSVTIDNCCRIDDDRENLISTIAGICLGAAGLSHGKPKEKNMHEWSDSVEERNNEKKVEPVLARRKKSGKKQKKKKK